MPAIPGGIEIGIVYVAAPDGFTENWPGTTPVKGAPTGGPAAGTGLGGGTESILIFRPSGKVASFVPSPLFVTESWCELGVAVTLWLPTVHVSSDPDSVATNGACVVGTNVVGGNSGGDAMKPLWFVNPFAVP
jgi:hypothetical protein